MIQETELFVSLALVAVAGTAVVAYAGRSLLTGKFRSERVEKLGGSLALGQWAMDMGYWLLGPLERLCAVVAISPNAITVTSLLLGAGAGILLGFGHFGYGAVLGTLASLCDMLDGQVARRRGKASEAGEVIDAAVDRYVDFFILAGLAIHYRDSVVGQLLSLAALLASVMISYSTAKAEALALSPPRALMRRHERLVYLLSGAALTAILRWGDYPMLAALALIAGIGNIAAARRFVQIARLAWDRGRT